MGKDVVAARFMRSSIVRDNKDPIRIAKYVLGSGFSPLVPAAVARESAPLTKNRRFVHGSAPTHPHETTALPALYEHGEARHLCRTPSLNSVRLP